MAIKELNKELPATENVWLEIFHEENAVPENAKVKFPIHQKEYLINGELRIWEGKSNTIKSPVYFKTNKKARDTRISFAFNINSSKPLICKDYKSYPHMFMM